MSCRSIVSLLSFLFLLVSAGSSAQELPNDAVWIAEADGALRITATDGTPLVEVTDLHQVRAAAVDLLAENVWLLSGGDLYRYDFSGNRQAVVELAAPDTHHVALIAHPTQGDVWVAVGNELWHVDATLEADTPQVLSGTIQGLAHELASDTLWVATDRSLETLAPDSGVPVLVVALPANAQARALSIDGTGARVWLALTDEIRIYGFDGEEIDRLPVPDVEHLAAISGGAWAATKKDVLRLSQDGSIQAHAQPFGNQGKIVALAATWNRSLWAADQTDLVRLTEDGVVARRLTLKPPSRIWGLGHADDVFVPILEISQPASGACTSDATPTFVLSWSDVGAGIDTASLRAKLDGSALEATWETREGGATLQLEEALSDGPHQLVISISDLAGNPSSPAESSWTIDTVVPTFLALHPGEDTWTSQPVLVVSGILDEPVTVELFLGDSRWELPVEAGESFTSPELVLSEGPNPVLLIARDCAGNSTTVGFTVVLDTVAPPPVDLSLVTAKLDGTAVSVLGQAGAAEPNATVEIRNTTNGEETDTSAGQEGSFAVTVSGAAGDVLELVAIDRAGNSSPPVTLTVEGDDPGDLPPDPTVVAPPVDTDVTTDIAESTAFLYEGTDPIQQDVTPGAIDAARVTVLRGRVLDRSGAPLPGVQIEVHGQPDLGWTLSRGDGTYDLAVNGGGQVVLSFRADGRLPAQRRIETSWRDWVAVEDVALVELDPNATLIAAGAPTLQVARGSRESDADGERQATVLFPAGTNAAMTLPDGSTAPLSSLTVRATEFTVGPNGPRAMPAELPPASGYTYAVELSVDEAGTAGATSVTFGQPLPLYVENFLGFPVGGIVPIGYYDRQGAVWVPSSNGLVVEILGVVDGLAELDVDGSGTTAGPEALADLGIGQDELHQLAILYSPGTSLWRSPISHFTPWDCNWPYGPPLDAQDPPNPFDDDDPLAPDNNDDAPDEEDPTCEDGSIIECENQTLRKRIELPGVPFDLYYSSARVLGRQVNRRVKVRVTGPDPSPSLKRAEVRIDVAGQEHEWTFGAEPNQVLDFVWDGRDGYGRRIVGDFVMHVRVRHIYPLVYLEPPDFTASFGSLSASVSPVGGRTLGGVGEIAVERQRNKVVTAQPSGLWSWSLGPHHRLASFDTIQFGDGRFRRFSSDVGRVAGNRSVSAHGGDGGPATEATFAHISGLAVAEDGSIYIADREAHRVRRISPEGVITTVAGTGVPGGSGDGGPAAEANLESPRNVVPGPDGSLFIQGAYRVRKVDPSGTISTLPEIPPDGSWNSYPRAVALGPDALLYVATGPGEIWRYEADGALTKIAGIGDGPRTCRPEYCLDDGGSALNAYFSGISDMAFDAIGNLYVSSWDQKRIRRITRDGIIKTIVGGGKSTTSYHNDGELATEIYLFPESIAFNRYGELIFEETPPTSVAPYRLRKLAADGRVYTIAGGGGKLPGFGWPPLGLKLLSPTFDFLSDGTMVMAENFRSLWSIRTTEHYSKDVRSVSSKDGALLYDFDWKGRHLQTRSALTGETLLTMEYDEVGDFVGIVDAEGNRTTIERDQNHDISAIVGPFGSRIPLTFNEFDFLEKVTFPSGHFYHFEYSDSGLLELAVDPLENATIYQYSTGGRLTSATDAVLATKIFSREAGGEDYRVTQTTASQLEIRYDVEKLPSGGQLRTRHNPDGTQTQTEYGPDRAITMKRPDGTIVEVTQAPHPRFGLQAPLPTAKISAGPLMMQVSTSAQVQYPDPDDPSAFIETDTIRLNGKLYNTTYDSSSRTIETTTPEGRNTVALLDPKDRVTSLTTPGVTPTRYEYDAHGRLEYVRTGEGDEERTWQLVYGADGRVSETIDPLDRKRTYNYDDDGYPGSLTTEDHSVVGFDYDAAGRLKTITPPEREAHEFTYTPVSLADGYIPPAVEGSGPSGLLYDKERRPELATLGDGQQVSFDYDTFGRLEAVHRPDTDLTFAYHPSKGQLSSVSRSDGSALSFNYTGFLRTDTTWIGEVSGSVSRRFDDDFRISRWTVAGTAITHSFDLDGLLTRAGDLTISRSATTGFITGTSLGTVVTEVGRNDFGELDHLSASTGSSQLYDLSLERDKLGRIVHRTEAVGGIVETYVYGYDLAGRLETVEKNGSPYQTYAYDANGNRLTFTDAWETVEADYDEQDRLLTYGAASYFYNGRGQLQSKTVGQWTTTYDYDVAGNLRRVDLPNGTVVEYLVDPADRRIGKKVDGVLVQGFLYQDKINPIVELDGAGNVVARFVYGTLPQVPDYVIKNGRSYRYVTDQAGSVRLIVDTVDGGIVQRIDYDPFGRVLLDSNPGFQPFGFAGGLMDPHTHLVRFGARDYDPGTGRWMAKDPISFAGGDTNLYGYVLSDPVNWIDPSGLSWLDDHTEQIASISAGIGDALLFGFGDELREWTDETFGLSGSGVVDRCSGGYRGASIATTAGMLAVSLGRLAYAGAAKGVSIAARMAGTEAAALRAASARDSLKVAFRLGLDRTSRITSAASRLEKYGSAKELAKAAGRTSPSWNSAAAGGVGGAVNALFNLSECDCQ